MQALAVQWKWNVKGGVVGKVYVLQLLYVIVMEDTMEIVVSIYILVLIIVLVVYRGYVCKQVVVVLLVILALTVLLKQPNNSNSNKVASCKMNSIVETKGNAREKDTVCARKDTSGLDASTLTSTLKRWWTTCTQWRNSLTFQILSQTVPMMKNTLNHITLCLRNKNLKLNHLLKNPKNNLLLLLLLLLSRK